MQSIQGIKLLAAAAAMGVTASSASAAGIDSRAYTCGDLHALVARQGFVFISQATFGDFVVNDVSLCDDNGTLQTRTVATSDQPECPVNYCIRHSTGGGGP
jgi:hypothetical protein